MCVLCFQILFYDICWLNLFTCKVDLYINIMDITIITIAFPQSQDLMLVLSCFVYKILLLLLGNSAYRSAVKNNAYYNQNMCTNTHLKENNIIQWVNTRKSVSQLLCLLLFCLKALYSLWMGSVQVCRESYLLFVLHFKWSRSALTYLSGLMFWQVVVGFV